MDHELIFRATILATQAHNGQTRRGNGDPYILHPLRVAQSVAGVTIPFVGKTEAVAAAVLHDVIEDTDVESIPLSLGNYTGTLVKMLTHTGVSKLTTMTELVEVGMDHPWLFIIKMADMGDNIAEGLVTFKNGRQWAEKQLDRAILLLEGAKSRDQRKGIAALTETEVYIKLSELVRNI